MTTLFQSIGVVMLLVLSGGLLVFAVLVAAWCAFELISARYYQRESRREQEAIRRRKLLKVIVNPAMAKKNVSE